MSNPNDYTVAWICAIHCEYVAAQALLDETHDRPEYVSRNDNNDYTLGRIGKLSIVVAVLAGGEYGTSPAAGVARAMVHSFPNVRIAVMVGIGGGAPSAKHDIRLGDVVVGTPRNGKSGVVKYDVGRIMQNQSFQPTGFLSQPPEVLQSAVSGLKAQYEADGHDIEDTIRSVLEKKPRLRKKYKRPDPSTDRLYHSRFTHRPNLEASCASVCGSYPSNLILRAERAEDEDNPAIHYGLIASANQVMKNALVRDKLAAEKDILCFETEAAGLMNHFPCLIIRGICGYSDTHKNKEWQGYAALAASAYTKGLLSRVLPSRIQAEKRIGDILSETEMILSADKLKLEDVRKPRRFFRLGRVFAMLWIEPWSDHQRVQPPSYPGFSENRVFSEIRRFIVVHESYRASLCVPIHTYGGRGLQKHNLRVEDHARIYRFDSEPPTIEKNTPLREPIGIVIEDNSELQRLHPASLVNFGKIYTVEHDVRVTNIGFVHRSQSHRLKLNWKTPIFNQPGITSVSTEDKKRVSASTESGATSRLAERDKLPEQIVKAAAGKQMVISEKLTVVHFAALFGLPDMIIALVNIGYAPDSKESCGRTPLSYAAENGHFVVVNLLLEMGNVDVDSKDQEYGRTPLLWAAGNGHSAVVKLLLETNKVDANSKDEKYGRTPLSWAAGNGYPEVVNLLLGIGKVDVNSKDKEYGRTPLSWAAENGHSTVVNLLLKMSEIDVNSKDRKYGGTPLSWAAGHGHSAVVSLLLETNKVDINSKDEEDGSMPLLWAAGNGHSEVVSLLLEISRVDVNWKDEQYGRTPLLWAARNGHLEVVSLLLEISRIDVNSKDKEFGRTPLSWAAGNGHFEVVNLLLRTSKVDADSKDEESGRTPLSWAAGNGYLAVVNLLLKMGRVDADSKNEKYDPTLSLSAVTNGHQAIVELLSATSQVALDFKDKDGQMPLWQAVVQGREVVFELPPTNGRVDINRKDKFGWMRPCDWDDSEYGRTPLSWAAANGHEAVVELLLATQQVDPDSKDWYRRTPLWQAAASGHKGVVELLLATGRVDPDSKDKDGRTPLWQAAASGHEVAVKQLLDTDRVDPDAKDKDGRTPLWQATTGRHDAVVQLLLATGRVDQDLRDEDTQTAVSWVPQNGYDAAIELVLTKGAHIDVVDRNCRTLLWTAESSIKPSSSYGIPMAPTSTLSERMARTRSWATEDEHEDDNKLLRRSTHP